MPTPDVYIGHLSPNDDAICSAFVTALRRAGVPKLHYEQFTPETGTLTVVVIGELSSRPVNLILLSAEALQSPIVRDLTETEHTRAQNDPLRILLPVVVGPIAEADIWPFLQGYPRIEAAPGVPYPQAQAIRHTLETLALAPLPSGLMGLFSGGFTPNPIVYAKALYWKGDDAQAQSRLQRVAQSQPQSFDAWYTLGALLEQQRSLSLAVAAYDKAIEINGMYPNIYLKKALVLNTQGRYEDALIACNIALAYDIRSTVALNLKGSILDDLKRYDEALGAYERTVYLDPDMVDAWSNMGVTLRKLHRLDEAKTALERAIALDSAAFAAHVNLANVYLEMPQTKEALEEALAEVDKALAIDGTNPIIWYTRGRALAGLRRFPEALAALQRCPNLPPARSLRAEVEQAMRS